ncbi:MAG: GHKL domain-containing protein [Proteobacteria bacterium]|nr:GHKL domain-containing protein [Pseudomonadota bacterium]
MNNKPKNKVRSVIGIIVIMTGISITYLILANLLFSRTYDMLSKSLITRAESNVERLAAQIPFDLVAGLINNTIEILEEFKQKHRDVDTIVVLDSNLKEFTRVGNGNIDTFLNSFKPIEQTKSIMDEGVIITATPCRIAASKKAVGYVIYNESLSGYLSYRRQMMLFAILVSVFGLAIVGKLLHSQIIITLENDRLLLGLKAKAHDLKEVNEKLQSEIEEKTSAQKELSKYRDRLEELVKKRTAELKKTQNRLLEASRRAGMAEVATGVLHNVGNVLNTVNVSANFINDTIDSSETKELNRVVRLLRENESDLVGFFTEDKRGRMLPEFIEELDKVIKQEQLAIQRKCARLTKNIDQIKVIIALQQSYSKLKGICEPCDLREVVEDAIRIEEDSLKRHHIAVSRNFEDLPLVILEKQKVVQILVNIISNAEYAMNNNDKFDRLITLNVRRIDNDLAEIDIEDNGVGIPHKNLKRIFNHGFTTRKGGHGFGLHSAANACRELGWKITVLSEGKGKGAVFKLKIPIDKGGTANG